MKSVSKFVGILNVSICGFSLLSLHKAHLLRLGYLRLKLNNILWQNMVHTVKKVVIWIYVIRYTKHAMTKTAMMTATLHTSVQAP